MSQDNIAELTMPYILRKLDDLANNTDYLLAAIQELRHIRSEDSIGVVEAIKLREQTNQQLIALYTQMYTDLAKKTN